MGTAPRRSGAQTSGLAMPPPALQVPWKASAQPLSGAAARLRHPSRRETRLSICQRGGALSCARLAPGASLDRVQGEAASEGAREPGVGSSGTGPTRVPKERTSLPSHPGDRDHFQTLALYSRRNWGNKVSECIAHQDFPGVTLPTRSPSNSSDSRTVGELLPLPDRRKSEQRAPREE